MAATLLHKAPFLRLLTATAIGIVWQRYLPLQITAIVATISGCLLLIALYSFTHLRKRFRLSLLNGLLFTLLFVALGAGLVWLQDMRNNQQWVGRSAASTHILVTLQEPLVEKANSFKAEATVEGIVNGGSVKPAAGRVIVYFRKDSLLPALGYGSQIVFQKPLQEIKNAGNPGSFDYKAYCLYQGITHQVFLSTAEFVPLSTVRTHWLKQLIFSTREWVVNILRRYIAGEKEQGLAEALLIGYKDDLDKNLVQAYSNTGVVHIIAISGLHLGLIYWLLMALTRPLKRKPGLVWLRLLIVIAALWAFTLLAGAQPSVLRSAVMFTVIALGEGLVRKSNIFNTLACSALVLLCINPYWLWDVGFQLSYTAVLSIVLFYKPVSTWYLPDNGLLKFLWSLTAVTIAAQVLTLPISVFHFHQFPLLFLFANFVAVPLSSLILLAEILLCALWFIAPLATLVGRLLSPLIGWMNTYVEGLNNLPFAVWNALSISVVQTVLALVAAVAGCFWLMERQRRFAWLSLVSIAGFMALRAVSFTQAEVQRKLIVYNVPKRTAIDIIQGRQYAFIGDTSLLYDDYLRNFHLQPSRILHRTAMTETAGLQNSFLLNGKQIVLLDETLAPVIAQQKPVVDVLVLAKNPRVYITKIAAAFDLRQVVIDGSVPPWKATLWKKDCDSLHIACHNVAEDGAFVMNW